MHSAAMRVRHAMAFATHKFFNDRGFLYIHTPIVTGADCEGAGEQFAVSTLLPDPHGEGAVEGPPTTATGAVDYSKVRCSCSPSNRGAREKVDARFVGWCSFAAVCIGRRFGGVWGLCQYPGVVY